LGEKEQGFHFGVVNSEVSPKVEDGVAFAASLGMGSIELEDFWGLEAWQASAQLLERAYALVEASGLYVSVIGTQAFKLLEISSGDATHPSAIDGWVAHRAQIDGALQAAQILQCRYVRVFSGRRTGMIGLGNPSPRLPEGGPIPHDCLGSIVAVLRDAGDQAAAVGVTLLVENVRSCWGNSMVNAARILEAVDHPYVRLIWDPGNDFVAGGDGSSTGYRICRSWIKHVHVKDARIVDLATGLTAWEAIGRGELDFEDLLRTLIVDGYTGAVNLETHWHPKGQTRETNSRESFRGLRQALDLALETLG
tara:strand:- start:103 stop:1026 length:924 start_codon:yes stop_codon:yes gene_type:complete